MSASMRTHRRAPEHVRCSLRPEKLVIVDRPKGFGMVRHAEQAERHYHQVGHGAGRGQHYEECPGTLHDTRKGPLPARPAAPGRSAA